MIRYLPSLPLFSLLFALGAGPAIGASTPFKPVRIILVGDSTMASNSGYGDALCQRLAAPSCINLAKGGRSSGSFRAEGRWDEVQALLRDSAGYSATYVLIQFGHNDQPGKPGRSTDLVSQFPANIERYAQETSALGGVPVLLTPLTRRTFRGAYVHNDLAPWSAAVRKIANKTRAPLLDLNALSLAHVEAMGQQRADTLARPEGFDRTHLGVNGADVFSQIVADELRRIFPAIELAAGPKRPAAQADGWAGQEGGTIGGAAPGASVHTVANRAQLLAALAASGSRIVHVEGMIDMSEGKQYTSSADQASRGTIKIPSHTTLVGAGGNAGFINASLVLSSVSQVVIRNLHMRNPCDVAPRWDPNDGAKGNWNSLYDAITVSASTHVWIDHNTFTDAPDTDDAQPVVKGMPRQCHDGALDIGNGSDLVTVSYNHFALHEKNSLVGSSDKATGDEGRLRITFANNLFEHVVSRAPRVRFGKVHLLNNYYLGDRKRASYGHEYSVGVGMKAKIISHNNVFDIAGARDCDDVVRNPAKAAGAFADGGSLLNGSSLANCPFSTDTGWTVPYPFSALPASSVREHVLAHAGAGKLPHYVQATLRPLKGDGGQLYLMGSYADAANWAGAGLKILDAATVQVDISVMRDGVLSRLKQVRRKTRAVRAMTLRFDMDGRLMTAYLDGERLTSAAQPRGLPRAGTHWQGDGFELLKLRKGEASMAPARLAATLPGNRLSIQAGDPPQRISLAAFHGDGSGMPLTARSSNPGIAGVEVDGAGLVVTARSVGTAVIVAASASDPVVQTEIEVVVSREFRQPGHVYKLRKSALAQPVDTPLRLVFDSPPVLGDTGSVRIFRRADDALVDIIRPGEAIFTLGFAGQERQRRVTAMQITVSGSTVVIKPQRKLAYGTEYYVAIDDGVIQGRIAGKPFAGIGKAGGWTFRTRPAAPKGTRLIVDDDGPADFRTVQGALDHVMQHLPRHVPATISVRNGTYHELLYLRAKDKLTLKGQSRDGVVIHATNNDGLNPGSGASQDALSPGIAGGRALMLVEDADLLTLDSLTLKNTTLRASGQSAQAEALYFNNDKGRLTATNAAFLSEQDTLQLTGYAWFHNTLVAGNVDFIWGANRAALFEDSEIRTLGDSNGAGAGGYIVQARTVSASDPGFVFLNSRLTRGVGPAGDKVSDGSAYLARSPGTASTWDKVTFINCRMDAHIAPVGWFERPTPNPLRGGWREYGSMNLQGGLLNLDARSGGTLLGRLDAEYAIKEIDRRIDRRRKPGIE